MPRLVNSKRQILSILWPICLACSLCSAQTFSPRKALGRYQQFVWLEEHGLPQNTVQAITRTRDGYLWLGTLAGLARFDGARFTVFNNGNTREINGSYITALLEDRQGNLWLGADGGGIARYRDGRFSLFTTRDGLPNNTTKALLEDRDGALWIGTNSGLARFKDGRFTVYTTRDGLPGDSIRALADDGAGGLWVGGAGGLARFKDGRFTVYTTRDGLLSDNVVSLCFDRAGNLWIGVETGLCRLRDGRFTVHGAGDGLSNLQVGAIFQDREDNLWFGTIGGGLFRLAAQASDGRFARYTAKDGLPGDRVAAIYQDPEGDLWVGTDGGLSQLRDGRFQVYGKPEGLAQDFAHGVYEDRAGGLWVGTVNGLSRFKDGKIISYTAKDGAPAYPIMSIREDQAGDLWIGSLGGGVVRFQNGRFSAWTAKDGLANNLVRAVLSDHAGNLWIGTHGSGLNLWRDGRFRLYTTREGLASNYVRVLFEDRAGNLWIGAEGGGVSRFKDGRFTTWTTQDGLARNFVVSFYEDRRGSLWIGTIDGGISRFKDGKFATITAKDGLYDNVAFQILSDTDDDSGNLWMSCNRGIYRVSLRELNDFADGRIQSVTSFGYGVADGMLSRECNSGSPAGVRARDGRLWFPSTRGVVVIDPRRQNARTPLVVIERVTLNSSALPVGQILQIHPGQENLEIQYTGLSWIRPQQIRFRYKLVGLDQDWVEAGTRRTAYFPHLPPGAYTFTVIADNGEGVWNNEGQSLRIVVLPPFYRTWWFLTLVSLGVAGVTLFGYKLRVRQLQRARQAQENFSRRLIESQESERKRIATELHDSLGQHLLVIKNRAALGERLAPEPSPVREQLEEINASATQAISEVRAIAYNLRPVNLDRLGLTAVLEEMIEKVARSSGVQFSADIEPLDGLFTKEGEINCYRIIQESVNNIVRHAQATKAYVEIWREAGELCATVRDNGRGFDAEAALKHDDASRGSGLGLTSIGERVRLLGGALTLDSAPGRGATLNIRLPIAEAVQEREKA
jgi:ligand-binding sensor domain-containing protein/signal transduction histidine kinase